MSSHRTLFKEVQHLPKVIIYIITILLMGFIAYLNDKTYHMYLNETSIRGLSTEYKVMLGADILLTILILGIIFVVWNYRLVTKVSARSFYYKHPPINNSYKKIHTFRILDVKIAQKSDIPSGTKKIRMSGNEGVLLTLEDNKFAFIGSNHADSLKKAIVKMREQQ